MDPEFDPGQLHSAQSWYWVECMTEGATILRIGDRLAPKPLRLRIEPEGAAGPHWLTLLALIGWLRGVVVWDESWTAKPRTAPEHLRMNPGKE